MPRSLCRRHPVVKRESVPTIQFLLVSSFTSAVVTAFALAVLQTPQVPQFRSSIDLVQVDVSAVDGNGRPIRDLTVQDFDVRVDGKPRPIVSAQFVTVAPSFEVPAAPSPTAAFYSSNAEISGGRLIMIVVDRGSITAGRGKSVMDAASKFVERLNPADRVALASIPRGPQVDFTADHRLVQRLLQQVDGNAPVVFGVRERGRSRRTGVRTERCGRHPANQ